MNKLVRLWKRPSRDGKRFAYGLSEYEVMILAGHASFETTRRFYMAVRKDIIERARKAGAKATGVNYVF